MNIALHFEGEKLFAETEISFDENVPELSFILNSGLEISGVSCDEKSAEPTIETVYEPLFCAEVKKYSVKCGSDFGRVKICYSGKISGWHNIITDDIIELNRYGVWLPCEMSCEAERFLTVSGCEDYFLVKGEFDGSLWHYSAGEWDMNIIIYRKSKLQTVSGKYISIYYADNSLNEAADFSKNIFEDVLDYYTKELFRKEYSGGHMEMACLYPALTSGGAYKRDGLIVCISPGTDEKEAVGVNAHEMAHTWCSGADVGSWEDWLNETTAEWSMLLYCLDRNKTEIFDAMIAEHMEKSPGFPPIKTADGSRPEGVHTKGTVLFYKLYKTFGAETIKSAIRIFVGLEAKTTEKLLAEMRAQGLSESAGVLEKGLAQK
ncbi:MAG: M1 family metallopeptidase [Ruminococcus sp.]|nr:M1 family metallopeptidase [Ruminococcus sp.]